MSKAKEVWETLSKIDVNKHTDTKNNFTYLSWTWAWATLQENYPDSVYSFRELLWLPNDTCEIWVDLTVEGITRSMWLAVTDFRNKPVSKPSCDLIANARMRCLVKAIAMFGLGHYIYAGESLPMEASKPEPKKEKLDKNIIGNFNSCKTMDDLVLMWGELSPDEMRTYATYKDNAKKRLQEQTK